MLYVISSCLDIVVGTNILGIKKYNGKSNNTNIYLRVSKHFLCSILWFIELKTDNLRFVAAICQKALHGEKSNIIFSKVGRHYYSHTIHRKLR